MARAKKCEEEFNPWPAFVDLFSSVILVLLLFIMVTIVNVAYYMQFNSKTSSEATTKSATDNLQAGADTTDMISIAKQEKPKLDAAGNDSLFTGGKSQGNALSVSKDESKAQEQKGENKNGELLISYHDKGIYSSAKMKSEIEAYIKAQKRKNPNAKFQISVAQPTKVLGRSLPKQISLGRALNVKTTLKKSSVSLSNIKLKMFKNRDEKHPFGYVKIKVIQ